MKPSNKSKNIFLKSLIVLFILLYVYFASFTSRNSYIGISSDYKDKTWIIKKIHRGGVAASSNLSVGDQILKINNKDSKTNYLLNKMLIVEQATSITTLHKNKVNNILLNKRLRFDFLIFSILSFSLLLLLLVYFRSHEISRTSRRYFIFLFLTSLFLSSIVPSSMGNIIARFILILYITIFPLFIDIFGRASTLDKGIVHFSTTSKLLGSYSLVTLVLFLYSCYFDVPIYVPRYLSRYIFYISLLFLILLLFSGFYRSLRGKSFDKLTIFVSVILGVLPLFIGYIFPFSYEVPIIFMIPLLIFPILTILNSLITNRLVNIRFQLPNFILYLLISLIVTIDFLCLFFLTNCLPYWFIIIYIFLFIYSLLPVLKDLLIINSKKEYQLLDNNSIFSVVEAEREEISIYLHDTIIQDMIYYKRQIEGLEFISQNKAQEMLDDVIFELRELCSNIYPLMIKELGLQNAILDIIDKFQKKESVIITMDANVDKFYFENNVANFILRSIREVINNSIIHGNAKNIKLQIYSSGNMVTIEVIDDGYFGMANEVSSSHFGLDVVAEKLFLLGGELIITKNPTTVKMLIPNRRKEKNSYD